MAQQAQYLHTYHKSGHNWTTMEMNGLALTGLAFPEFRFSSDWSSYALKVMSEEIERQVYPDGVQTEISTKTQWVALRRFESLASNFSSAGHPVEASYISRIEEMYNYLAFCMRPDGHQPLNNDSDREDLRTRVLQASEKFDRQDWKYIATNGSHGKQPGLGPTRFFPWAGIALMSSGWDKMADWSFFDIGPYGTGHQHRDMLHLSISAFGHDLLVDGGRYTHRDYFSFDPSVWRGYFRSSHSHNVLLIDDKGQKAGPHMSEKSLIEGKDYFGCASYDFATGEFSSGFEGVPGKVSHTRSVLYLKTHQWLVIDNIKLEQPHKVTALWHVAPDLEMTIEQGVTKSSGFERPNLAIIPFGDINWKTEIIWGREAPTIQGWYSADYNRKVPNSTATYSARIDRSHTFGWWIIVNDVEIPEGQIKYIARKNFFRIQLALENQVEREVIFPWDHQVDKIIVR